MDSATAAKRQIKIVTISRALADDLETPISAFLKLCPAGPAFMLESAAGGEQVARYSFLGYNPFLTLKAEGLDVELSWRDGLREKSSEGPFQVLRQLMKEFAVKSEADLPRFSGGAVGYLSYDLVSLLEPVGELPADELALPDAYLQFMENMVIFDHFTHKIHLRVNRLLQEGESREVCEAAAVKSLQAMEELLAEPIAKQETAAGKLSAASPASNITKGAFMENIRRAKEYIFAGHIFQVVLSQRFAVPVIEDALTIYRRLRRVSPSPYMFLLRYQDVTLIGASPEMLTRVEGKKVTTRPIAGTRRRGATEEEDKALAAELQNDPKEMAEHAMLVDLGRNDLGRVSVYGTVNVSQYAAVERFSHVMHLVSEVSGELAEKYTAMDALMACFPAGTLTGAPKVRAMQIINELEKSKRGPYGGVVGYFDFCGNMDTCITIRTMVIKDRLAYIQTGAGIVADSVPEAEYHETMQKAEAMFAVLGVKKLDCRN
ncbi:MAG: anthranilate synthase component I [Clostridium sp.]|nr:anthranilate synthase component I [Clostridium sp.]